MHHLMMHQSLPFDVGMRAGSADSGLLCNCADGIVWNGKIKLNERKKYREVSLAWAN